MAKGKTKDRERRIMSKEKVHSFTSVDKRHYTLTEREKMFCDLYVKTGGVTAAVIKASYNVKDKKIANAMGHQMLKKDHIMAYINKQLSLAGFNDTNVKKQHTHIINQHGDLPSKNKAIDMYYKVQGQYAPEKHEVAIAVVKVVDYSKKKIEDVGVEVVDAE